MKQEIKERMKKIRAGEVPEGYRKTKVGILPDDWELEPLGNLFNFKNGVNAEAEKYGKGIKFVNIMEIINNNSLSSKLIPGEVELSKKAIKEKLVIKGDVLFNRTSETAEDIGLTSVYLDDTEVVFGGFVIRGRQKKKVLHDIYKKYCFRFSYLRNQIRVRGQGVVRSNIGQKDLEKVMLNIPRPNEQQKIAKILSTWDEAIELKEKLIEEKKKLRIATVNDLLFGLKRFDDFIKSHKYTPTKYINIPEDWEFIKIGDISTEVSEKNGNHEELPVLSCTKHSGLVDSLTYFKKRVFSEDTSTYKQVKKNQFVYATNHIDEGSIGCQNIYENSLVSPMYTVFKTNSKVNNNFLFSLLKTRLYIFIYQVNMSASVDRRGSLRWNDFSKIRIPLPDIAEQNKIVEFIRSVDNEIELLKLELNQLKEQKRGLMQLLLTGIVRVEVD